MEVKITVGNYTSRLIYFTLPILYDHDFVFYMSFVTVCLLIFVMLKIRSCFFVTVNLIYHYIHAVCAFLCQFSYATNSRGFYLPWSPVCTRLAELARQKRSPMLKTLHMSTWRSSRLEEKATQRSSISLRCFSGRHLFRRCEVRWWQIATASFWAFSRVWRSSSRSFRLSVQPPTHEAKCR